MMVWVVKGGMSLKECSNLIQQYMLTDVLTVWANESQLRLGMMFSSIEL